MQKMIYLFYYVFKMTKINFLTSPAITSKIFFSIKLKIIVFSRLFIVGNNQYPTTKIMIKLILILALLGLFSAMSFTPKTPSVVIEHFNNYDINHDGILSLKEVRKYFDIEYMKDFEGIDIDPKFLDSAYKYLIGQDKNGDGLDKEQFLNAIMPKEKTNKKTEPEYYPEQEL